MFFCLSTRFEQLNTVQKLGFFKFLFLFRFVIVFSSISSRLLPARPLFLIVLHNGIKKHSSEKGVICDAVSERRIVTHSNYSIIQNIFTNTKTTNLLKIYLRLHNLKVFILRPLSKNRVNIYSFLANQIAHIFTC